MIGKSASVINLAGAEVDDEASYSGFLRYSRNVRIRVNKTKGSTFVIGVGGKSPLNV